MNSGPSDVAEKGVRLVGTLVVMVNYNKNVYTVLRDFTD